MKKLDLTGQKFGRLTAIKPLPGLGNLWLFKCDCGNDYIQKAKFVRFSTKSCGCILREISSIRCSTLNKTHGRAYKPEWVSWNNMKQRCNNSKAPNYSKYGKRGIKVTPSWEKFSNFFADMGPRPEGTTLDRIDGSGNYEPGNCRWATPKQQRHNRSR